MQMQKSKIKISMFFKLPSAEQNLKFLIIFGFLLSFLPFPAPAYAYAQVDSIGQSQINPASPLYFLKSVREILELKFAGTTHVTTYRQLEFATRRIREVKSLSYTSHQDLIEPTLARYLSHLQELDNIANIKDQILAAQITEAVTEHMNVLQNVYNQVSSTVARRSIRATVYRLSEWNSKLASKLSLLNKYPLAKQLVESNFLGCNLLAKEASSSALNEVEKAVFKERAKECLAKLGSIRL